MRCTMPVARIGQRIGLLGGSFDPPHQGHVHISREALRRFDLTQIWWLVTPGNPLKAEGPAPMEHRVAAARALLAHPRVTVTDIERQLGTRYTAETIEALMARYPHASFTWLMGADNLADIHRWEAWPRIFAQVPVGVLARPGDPVWARTARAARLFRSSRLPASHARLLGRAMPPCWCYLKVPMIDISSSTIRASGGWIR